MKYVIFTVPLLMAGCGTQNICSGGNDFCLSMLEEIGPLMNREIERELKMESPQGEITKPYSRKGWNRYWNNRIFHVYSIGEHSCNSKYRGPSGASILAEIMEKRRELGLPELIIEERNHEKQF